MFIFLKFRDYTSFEQILDKSYLYLLVINTDWNSFVLFLTPFWEKEIGLFTVQSLKFKAYWIYADSSSQFYTELLHGWFLTCFKTLITILCAST